MELLEILDELEDTIDKSFNFFGMTVVNKEDLLSMIEELRLKFPDELKQAKWVKEERQRILSEAEKEAQNIIDSGKEKVLALIDEHEIARQAKLKAEEIMNEAKRQELEMRKNAIGYADSLLERVESISSMVLDESREGRRQLKK